MSNGTNDEEQGIKEVIIPEDKSQKFRKKKSFKTLIEYFNDDQTDEKKREEISNPYFYHQHKVSFSCKAYIEFFLIHLFSIFLGPFMCIYSLIFWKNKKLMYNTFLFRNSRVFYFQQIYWVATIFMLYIIFSPNAKEYSVGDSVDVAVLIFCILIKCSTIAGKYSTFPEGKLRKVKEVRLTFEDTYNETMFEGWMGQKEMTVDSEIYDSMVRGEIEMGIFKVAFMREVGFKTNQEIFKIAQEFGMEQYKFYSDVTEGMGQRKIVYYDASLVFKFIVKKFKDRSRCYRIFSECLGICIAAYFCLISTILRLIRGERAIGDRAVEYIGFFLNIFNTFMMIYTLVLANGVARIDILRKKYAMKQLGQLISPKRLENYSGIKLLPTVNLLDPLSLKTWLRLRFLVLDYGKRYFIRHEILIPLFFFCAAGSMGLSLCLFFFFSTNQQAFSKSYLIQGGNTGKLINFTDFNFLMLSSLLMVLLYKAASINNEFDHHIKILTDNGKIYRDLLNFKELYFEELAKENDERNCLRFYRMKKEKISCHVQLAFAREIKKILGKYLEKFCEEYLENLIRVNNECIEDLENEKRFNSLKLLGLTITTTGANNLLIAFISIFITVFELFGK